MALGIFIDKEDAIEVEVYAFDKEDGLEVVTDVKDVPPDTEPEKLSFTFRRPNHKDSTEITSSTLVMDADGIKEFNAVKLQDTCFRKLLKKWSLTDKEDKPVPVSAARIDALHPNIVRTVAGELVGKISF